MSKTLNLNLLNLPAKWVSHACQSQLGSFSDFKGPTLKNMDRRNESKAETFAWRIESVFAELPEVLMRHDSVVLTFPKAENSFHTAEVY